MLLSIKHRIMYNTGIAAVLYEYTCSTCMCTSLIVFVFNQQGVSCLSRCIMSVKVSCLSISSPTQNTDVVITGQMLTSMIRVPYSIVLVMYH